MSSRSRRPLYGVSPRSRLTFLLTLWVLAEIVAFALVVQAAGIGGALAIGVLTTCAGAIALQRLGRAAAAQVRTAARNGGVLRGGAGMTDGLLQALAAILLILPGFISDAVGAALSIGPLRRLVWTSVGRVRRAGLRDRPRKSGIVDLQPEDWRHVDGRE